MSGQHRDVPPDDCASCCTLFAVLTAHHQDAPDVRLTTAAVGKLSNDLGERAARLHLSHLYAHQRIKADRRTPVPGAMCGRTAAVQPGMDPLQWAAVVVVPDATCGRLLMAYVSLARGRWAGQATEAELADAGRMSVRTMKRHRPHLRTAGLLVLRRRTVPTGGAHPRRLPDQFELTPAPGVLAVDVPQTPATLHERAADVITGLSWWHGDAAEYGQAAAAVADCLSRGWPVADVAHALTDRLPARIARPAAFLVARLQERLPGYAPAVRREAAARPGPVAPRRGRCRECERPFADGRTPDGALCARCREEAEAAGASVPAPWDDLADSRASDWTAPPRAQVAAQFAALTGLRAPA
ncbi:hypothetical protein ACGRHY_29985 [Streptomyces sp. HK10]|uniref:hypothetical protein n=1 Tax=Streptomyces sp. HK10 TaxID=3373255 RepID=UPI003748AA91